MAAAVFIALTLAWAARDLNFVSSDEENLYFPAARHLRFVHYPSQLCHAHTFDNPQLLHGKEVSIWHFSLMQRLLNDFDSLRPLLWTVIIAWTLSAIFVFKVSAFYWGETAGLACFALFVSSFWPYVYVLLVKHQPIGLCYFLAAVLALQRSGRSGPGRWWGLVSGGLMAAALHASTVVPLYLPLYLVAVFQHIKQPKAGWQQFALILAGGAAVVCYMNYPHVIANIREFWEYVRSSRMANHFSYHQNVFRAWLADPARAYGGWEWTFKYLWLAMPVLFPCYLILAVLLLRRHWPMVLLSFSPILMANLSHVAQYGGNYFPCLMGVLLLFGYALKFKPMPKTVFWSVLVVHVVVNAFILLTDVYPGRMASVYLSRALQKHHIFEIFVHPHNAMNKYVIDKMDPRILRHTTVKPISNINQPEQGAIVLAPVVGSSIYLAMVLRHADFDSDIYLNELLRRRALGRYATGSFKTMASSRVWRQEEEMLSYRDLILHQFSEEYELKSRAWILDAAKIQADRMFNSPHSDYTNLVEHGIRNIGAKSNLYRYKGVTMRFLKTSEWPGIQMRVFKVGRPQDALVMYVYKYQPFGQSATWLPWTVNYASQPVSSQALGNDPLGQEVPFVFNPPLVMTPGDYDIVVYRTGTDSDRDYYRIYADEEEKSSYIQASTGL